MKPKRAARYRDVIARRQANLTVVLENVHDPHNIGAVMRTCDSVGIHEIFVVNTDTRLQDENLYIGNQTSSGARKWIKVHFYTAIEPCFQHIKSTYQSIWATHLSEQSKDLYELDLTQSVALLFGNEKEGISQEQYAIRLQHSSYLGKYLLRITEVVKTETDLNSVYTPIRPVNVFCRHLAKLDVQNFCYFTSFPSCVDHISF